MIIPFHPVSNAQEILLLTGECTLRMQWWNMTFRSLLKCDLVRRKQCAGRENPRAQILNRFWAYQRSMLGRMWIYKCVIHEFGRCECLNVSGMRRSELTAYTSLRNVLIIGLYMRGYAVPIWVR